MPFTKIGPNQHRSPSGKIFTDSQVALYKAHGDKFPEKGEYKRKRKKTPPSSRLLKRPIGG